jgi:hypothetical protein
VESGTVFGEMALLVQEIEGALTGLYDGKRGLKDE